MATTSRQAALMLRSDVLLQRKSDERLRSARQAHSHLERVASSAASSHNVAQQGHEEVALQRTLVHLHTAARLSGRQVLCKGPLQARAMLWNLAVCFAVTSASQGAWMNAASLHDRGRLEAEVCSPFAQAQGCHTCVYASTHTSSTTMWETSASCMDPARRRSRMPVVQNSSRVDLHMYAHSSAWAAGLVMWAKAI